LSVYVKYSAWLNATPERAKSDTSDGPRLSRLEAMRKAYGENYAPDMPPLDTDYLIGYLFEIGPTMAAGMGSGPITHEEILAWQELTGIELQPWEARFLRRLSLEYVSELHHAETLGYVPAWRPPDWKPEPSAVQLSLRALAQS